MTAVVHENTPCCSHLHLQEHTTECLFANMQMPCTGCACFLGCASAGSKTKRAIEEVIDLLGEDEDNDADGDDASQQRHSSPQPASAQRVGTTVLLGEPCPSRFMPFKVHVQLLAASVVAASMLQPMLSQLFIAFIPYMGVVAENVLTCTATA